mmetsp:Transcript_15449/g.25334  ORF Transcript_15449/g.25334 Transcript_15449/m.25334 type:complete len:375 (-) Transcript_15449:2659-3783(-)
MTHDHMFSSHYRRKKICGFPESRSSCSCYRISWSSSSAKWFFGALIILSFPLIRNFRINLSSEDDEQPLHQRSVRFIPYPHKTLGSGTSLQCQWETRPAATESYLDFTQQNAYTEGVCIPPTLNETLHIFSTEEAIECLSSRLQNRDIKLMLAGDSYMMNLAIGLFDILLSKHITGDEELLESASCRVMLSSAHNELDKRRTENATLPNVHFFGSQCYGRPSLNTTCRQIVNKLGGGNSSDYVWIIGAGCHIYTRQKNRKTSPSITPERAVSATVQEINDFLDTTDRIIFVSPPFYYPDKRFNDIFVRDQAEVYRQLLPIVAPENPAHPFLDVYELTRACRWKNCSYDRAHRSRFVNRWKAQMLLNTLCDVDFQ